MVSKTATLSTTALLILNSLMIGCSSLSETLTEEECQQVSPERLGEVDGRRGRTTDYFRQHQTSCQKLNIQFDEEAYFKAYTEGLKFYCTPEVAFQEGKDGQDYWGVCPDELHKTFEEAYKKGRDIFLLTQSRDEVRSEIARANEKEANDKTLVGDIKQVYYLLSGTSSTERLDRKEADIDAQIVKLKSEAPVIKTTLERQIDQVDYATNIAGAMTGTVFGFGLGHAIQGRYKETGWIFTVADAALLTTAIVAANQYCTSSPSTTDPSATTTNCNNALPALAMLGFFGVRIWQGIDLWTHIEKSPYTHKTLNKAPSLNLSLMPTGLLLTGTF